MCETARSNKNGARVKSLEYGFIYCNYRQDYQVGQLELEYD